MGGSLFRHRAEGEPNLSDLTVNPSGIEVDIESVRGVPGR